MKIPSVLLLTIAGLMGACTEHKAPNRLKNADVNNDTLAYAYKTVHERAADCGNKPDSACTSAKVQYPVFEGQQLLNDTLDTRLASLFTSDGHLKYSSIQQAAKSLLDSFSRDKKAGDMPPEMHYTLDSRAEVVLNDTVMVTAVLNGYYYQGGAHGITITRYLNWDMKQKKPLTLDDIFVPGYAPKLNAIAEQLFRKQELLSPTASLANDYFFKGDKFSLNNNFILTPLGIKFLYNPYEIKPYAAGQTSIEIPYEQLGKLIKPGSTAATYIK